MRIRNLCTHSFAVLATCLATARARTVSPHDGAHPNRTSTEIKKHEGGQVTVVGVLEASKAEDGGTYYWTRDLSGRPPGTPPPFVRQLSLDADGNTVEEQPPPPPPEIDPPIGGSGAIYVPPGGCVTVEVDYPFSGNFVFQVDAVEWP